MSSPPVLEARALSVRRGQRTLLREVSLTAKAGEVVGVLGPSGAGKSTLFRALVGDVPPDGGTVLLGGVDVTRWPLWRRARAGIGYVPQGPSVFRDLTVAANLATFLRLAGRDPAAAASESEGVAAAARGVDLLERLSVRAGDLSGGERRRLELARALAHPPKLLVCDEPFAGVDPAGASRLGRLLRGLAEAGAAVVLADHHVEEALGICTRALLLLDGAVAVHEEVPAFRAHPVVRGRYLGTWTPAAGEGARVDSGHDDSQLSVPPSDFPP